MKQNIMRGPLLKAGVVLLIFALLVYFTSTSAHGSVWSSIAMIFIGAINLVKWAFGMILGLAFCLAVLVGIFLGAVAMVNKESAASMYANLKVTLGVWFADGLAIVGNVKECSQRQQTASPKVEQALINDTTKVDEIHSMLEGKLNDLTEKIHALESKMDAFASSDKLDQVAGEVNASGDALVKLNEVLSGLETKVEDAHGKLQDISSEKLLGDLPGRVTSIESKDVASKDDIKPIVDLVERLQTEIQDSISAVAHGSDEESGSSSDSDQEAHRLFSYFEDVADQKKIQSLVEETLKKDMTYAQVMSHLVAEMGTEKGQIISDHPSLAKDYIRQIRRA